MTRSLLTSLLLSTLATPALASGALDTNFDGDGVLVFNAAFSAQGFDGLYAGLIDSQGRIVGAGYGQPTNNTGGTLVRLQTGGARDPGFGTNGVVRLPLIAPYDQLRWRAVVEQADGKLVVAGRVAEFGFDESEGRAYVCRVLPNGTPDPDFGSGGCVSPTLNPASSSDRITDLALQADGRIVLVGAAEVDQDGGLPNYVVVRLDADGSLDTCFGDPTCQSGGILLEPEPDADLPSFEARAVAIAQDQKIVIGGRNTGAGADFAVVRLQPTGSVDIGFGLGGHRTVSFDQSDNNFDRGNDLVVRDDNSIVLVGEVYTGLGYLVGVAGFDAFGSLLQGFGTQGKQILYFNDVSLQQYGTGIVEQTDGKLVISGYTNEPDPEQNFDGCGVARLLANGQRDDDFGFDGALFLDAGLGLVAERPEICRAIAVDARNIVLFGQYRPDPQIGDDSLVFRLGQDDLFRDGFEAQD